MKKNLALLTAALVTCAGLATADTVIQDFESVTSVAAQWNPVAATSGTNAGLDDGVADYGLSTDQANGGTNSCKVTYGWAGASGGVLRHQPTADLGAAADHSAEPWASFAVYGDASGDSIQFYLRDAGYESFQDEVTVDFTGWQTVAWDAVNDTAVGWVNGDGAIDLTSCFMCGIFVRQGAAAGTYTLYYDDFQFTAADPTGSSVSDWSILY